MFSTGGLQCTLTNTFNNVKQKRHPPVAAIPLLGNLAEDLPLGKPVESSLASGSRRCQGLRLRNDVRACRGVAGGRGTRRSL